MTPDGGHHTFSFRENYLAKINLSFVLLYSPDTRLQWLFLLLFPISCIFRPLVIEIVYSDLTLDISFSKANVFIWQSFRSTIIFWSSHKTAT